MLGEKSTVSLEERYFTDRRFFLFVQAVETALIQDYLAGRLAPSVKSRFEARYLSVPELRLRLEEVRGTQTRPHVPRRKIPDARLLMAAVILVCVGGAALWIYHNHTRFDSLPTSTPARPVLATLSLSPGLLKGDGVEPARLAPVSRKGDVAFILELPGQDLETLCSAKLSRALPDGLWVSVWSTPQPVWSRTSQREQQLTLRVDTSVLTRGDYLLEVVGNGSKVRETYSFRVSPM
jgi:hypothetical protein